MVFSSVDTVVSRRVQFGLDRQAWIPDSACEVDVGLYYAAHQPGDVGERAAGRIQRAGSRSTRSIRRAGTRPPAAQTTTELSNRAVASREQQLFKRQAGMWKTDSAWP